MCVCVCRWSTCFIQQNITSLSICCYWQNSVERQETWEGGQISPAGLEPRTLQLHGTHLRPLNHQDTLLWAQSNAALAFTWWNQLKRFLHQTEVTAHQQLSSVPNSDVTSDNVKTCQNRLKYSCKWPGIQTWITSHSVSKNVNSIKNVGGRTNSFPAEQLCCVVESTKIVQRSPKISQSCRELPSLQRVLGLGVSQTTSIVGPRMAWSGSTQREGTEASSRVTTS